MLRQSGIEITLTAPTILPDHQVDDGVKGFGGWIVTVYNNEVNTYDEVIMILMVATGCSMDEAYMETWEIDRLGKSVVHHAAKEECEQAASIITKIGIRVQVSQS